MPAQQRDFETEAPRAGPSRFLREFLPSWSGCGLASLGIVVLGLGLLLALLIGVSSHDAAGRRNPDAGFFFLSMLVIPVVALLTALAAVLSPRGGARALLLLATSSILVLGSFSCGRGMIALKSPPRASWVWSLVSYGGLALVSGAAGMLMLGITPREVRERLERDQREYVRRVLAARGGAATADLARALETTEQGIHDHLVNLVASGELKLRVEDRAGRVYTAVRASELLHRLATVIVERGRVPITDLARDLGEPQTLVEGWIGELLMSGRLVGTIDRERDLVVWDPLGDGQVGAREFRDRDCESCGGALRAVGGGLFRCVYCGAELEAEA
jgi:hypothetical protein